MVQSDQGSAARRRGPQEPGAAGAASSIHLQVPMEPAFQAVRPLLDGGEPCT